MEDAAGPLQLCAGQDGGCEAAVHAMRSIFQDSETEAVFLVDANNAFNSLNRKGALHNISTMDSRYSELEGTRQKVHYIRRFTITRVHKIRS